MPARTDFSVLATLLLDRAETLLLRRRTGFDDEGLIRLFRALATDAEEAGLHRLAAVSTNAATTLMRMRVAGLPVRQEIEDLLLDAVDEMREVVEGHGDEGSGVLAGLERRLGGPLHVPS